MLGIDVDGPLGAVAVAMLHGAGHRNGRFHPHDLTAGGPVPGGPFDVVYARLLLFHLPQRVAVLARLWDAVAPGGHLVVQDYDIRSAGVLPAARQRQRTAPGNHRRVHRGGLRRARRCARLAQLFAQAGVGSPDGTDVAGRIEPLASGRALFEGTFRSVLPAALAHGITTEDGRRAALAAIDRDAIRYADRPVLWPLLIGAWKRKEKE